MQTVQVIRSRRKTVSIEVHPDGEVRVRVPQRLPGYEIERMLREKQDWIQRKITEFAEREASKPGTGFFEGSPFLYLGQQFTLAFSERGKPALMLENGRFSLARAALSRAPAVFEAWYRQEARHVFGERVAHLAALTGLRPGPLRLSSARTRWGSCSSSGTLSLNWRLIMAPLEIIDYVIIHELAHLKIRNHQRAYWDLVEKMMPDYRVRRKWLKNNVQRLII